tara:strand:+ start:788 stop:985 length:198 start_codon:yes stop_codon:yes gene_type:complete
MNKISKEDVWRLIDKEEGLDYDKLEVHVIVTYKGKELDSFDVSDESLYSIYDDIEQYLGDRDGSD